MGGEGVIVHGGNVRGGIFRSGECPHVLFFGWVNFPGINFSLENIFEGGGSIFLEKIFWVECLVRRMSGEIFLGGCRDSGLWRLYVQRS